MGVYTMEVQFMKLYYSLTYKWKELIDKIKVLAKNELPKIEVYFPEFSDHSYDHSESLIQFIEHILPEESLEGSDKSLNEVEKFLILAGCYLHDIGMVPSQDQINQGLSQGIKDEIRKKHNRIIKDRIKNDEYKLGLDHHISGYLGDICLYHRGEGSISQIPDEIHYFHSGIRLQFIGALVRFADECHLTFDRIQKLTETYKYLSEESKKHFVRHYNISGVRIDGKTLEISIKINSPRDKEIFESTVKEKIEKEFQMLKKFLRYDELCRLRYINWQLIESEVYKAFTIDEIDKEIIRLLLLGPKTDNEIFTFLAEEFQENYGEYEYKEVLNYLLEEKFIVNNNRNYLFPEKFNVQLLREYCKLFSKSGIIDESLFYNNHFQKLLENEIFNTLVNFYNCNYSKAEKMDRIELLKDFPSILYLSLFGDQNVENYGLLNCERLLDMYCLLGMLVDSIRNPTLLNKRMGSLVNCINIIKDIQKNLPNFHRILNELSKLMNLSDEEVNNIFLSGKEEYSQEEDSIKFNLTLSYKVGYSHLTIPLILLAYNNAGIPFKINSQYIENVKSKDLTVLNDFNKQGNWEIIMGTQNSSKNSLKKEIKTTCQIDVENERVSISLNTKFNLDFYKYPFGAKVVFLPPNMNISFKLDLYFMEPRDFIRFNMFNHRNNYRQIKFIDGETGKDISIADTMGVLNSLNLSQEEENSIKALALYQEKINKSFSLPIFTSHITGDSMRIFDLNFVEKASVADLEKIYNEIDSLAKPEFIIYGVVLYDENQKMIDYRFTPIPGSINFNVTAQEKKNFVSLLKSKGKNIEEADINNLISFDSKPLKINSTAEILYKKTLEYLENNNTIPDESYFKDFNLQGESFLTYFTDKMEDGFWEKRRLIVVNIFSKLTTEDISNGKYCFKKIHV